MNRALARAGARIRKARDAAGLTTRALASTLGCSSSAVVGWENGKRDPGIDGLFRIAAALNVTPASLVAEDSDAPLVPRDVLKAAAEDVELVARLLRAALAERGTS